MEQIQTRVIRKHLESFLSLFQVPFVTSSLKQITSGSPRPSSERLCRLTHSPGFQVLPNPSCSRSAGANSEGRDDPAALRLAQTPDDAFTFQTLIKGFHGNQQEQEEDGKL